MVVLLKDRHSVAPMKQLLTPVVAYFLPQLGRKIGQDIFSLKAAGEFKVLPQITGIATVRPNIFTDDTCRLRWQFFRPRSYSTVESMLMTSEIHNPTPVRNVHIYCIQEYLFLLQLWHC